MKTIRLAVETLEIRSFATTEQVEVSHEQSMGAFCQSAVSETNGVPCKSCGPCCS